MVFNAFCNLIWNHWRVHYHYDINFIDMEIEIHDENK